MFKNWVKTNFLSETKVILALASVFGFFCLSLLFNHPVLASQHSISINTSSNIDINVQPDKSTVQSSDVNIITTCRSGYNLTLSTSGNDNHLYLNGDSSNNNTDTYFNPSDGNTALNSATNTWGYSLAVSSSTAPFTPTPPTTSNVFLPVPTANVIPATLKTTIETASDTSINDNFSVYYGVNASSTLLSGTYHMQNDEGTDNPGSIVYHVTMNPICAIELDLSFNENLDGAGEEGTDNTIINFPTITDNTADLTNNTLTLSSKVPGRDNYMFTGWNTEMDGSGSSYQPGDTIRVGDGTNELTGNITLYAMWEVGEAYTVTLDYNDDDIKNIEFHHDTYSTQTVTSDGGIVVLRANENYHFIINYEDGYAADAITTTANGTIGNTTVKGITYTITGNDTITITSQLKTGTTTLDTGKNLNVKIKTLAEGKSTTYNTTSSKIRSLRMASFLPSDFTPSTANTVSTTNSAKPVYIFFDNTNDAGIMYFYTEARDIYMNADSSNAFYYNTALSDISALAGWNTSNVTNMSYMFYAAFSLTDISALASWNTSNVTNMSYMFNYASSLTDISALAGWNTSNVTNMSYMFSTAPSLTDISALARWNTGNVTNMSYMFQYAYSLTDISALASWNTSNVKNMSGMFSNAKSLTNISALARWNTGNVTNMSYMFQSAYSLTDISALASWNTSNVTNMSNMFSNAYSLTNVSAIDNWNINIVTATAGSTSSSSNKFYRMFYDDPSHPNFNKRLGTWDNGTFVTTSDTGVTITVDLDDHIKGVSFSDSTYGTRTVAVDGGTIILPSGVAQDISVLGYDDGYTFSTWSTDNGTLGSTTSNPTTFTASSDATLTVTSTTASTSTVTINPDSHFTSINFKHPHYATKTITSDDINNNNNTITLVNNEDYYIIINYEDGYAADTITTTSNGTISNTTVQGITYTITGNDTITITSQLKTGTATLDTGTNLNAKIKTLAEGKSTAYNTTSSKIRSLRMASFLPSDFTPTTNNTVSTSDSTKPVYIFFDNTNDAGIMYFYTEARDIYMNADSSNTFSYNTALSDLSALAGWNTSNVTNMSRMFYNAYSLTDLSALASWNTSNVTDMSYMFESASSLTDLSALASWNTSNVTYMSYMFHYASSLTDISALASWNTSNVTSMSYMFQYAYPLTNISALASWNTSNVKNMSGMFYNALSLTDISALASWNTSNVTGMSQMFSHAYSLTDIFALASWNTSNVANMGNMFSNAYSLTDISALASWNTGNVTNMTQMFYNAYSLTNVSAIDNWDISKVTATAGSTSSSSNMFYRMFYNVPSHPNFTMRAGTWDSNGTFIPSA